MPRNSNRDRSLTWSEVLSTKTAYPVVMRSKDRTLEATETARRSTTYMATKRTRAWEEG